jgi:hypothetical protein
MSAEGLWDKEHDMPFHLPPAAESVLDRLASDSGAVELRQAHRSHEAAVRTVGAVFYALAVMVFVFGNPWVISAFVRATYLDRVGELPGALHWLEAAERALQWSWVENETLRVFLVLLPPVIYTVVAPYLLFCIGRGLRHLSPLARKCALVLLGLACLLALAALLISLESGAQLGAVGATLSLIAPAVAFLVLSVRANRVLFSPKYHALVKAAPGSRPELRAGAAAAAKIVMLLWGLGVLFVLGAIVGGPM